MSHQRRIFARETFPSILKEFVSPGKLTVFFRHVPIETVHKDAVGAAVAAECAGRQGRFWEMHDLLFSVPTRLDLASLEGRAQAMGLDAQAYNACATGDGRRAIEAQMMDNERLGLRSTPNFFLGNRLGDNQVRVSRIITGAQPLAAFTRELDRLVR